MTKRKALISTFVIFAAELILGIIDCRVLVLNSRSLLIPKILYFTFRTEILAIGAGILLKTFVGKAGRTVLFCAASTIVALAAELLCFAEGGLVFCVEILFLAFTAPIAILYYLFTYIFLTKPEKKTFCICVTAFVTVVLTIITAGFIPVLLVSQQLV